MYVLGYTLAGLSHLIMKGFNFLREFSFVKTEEIAAPEPAHLNVWRKEIEPVIEKWIPLANKRLKKRNLPEMEDFFFMASEEKIVAVFSNGTKVPARVNLIDGKNPEVRSVLFDNGLRLMGKPKKAIPQEKVVEACLQYLSTNSVFSFVEKAALDLVDTGEATFDIAEAIGVDKEGFLKRYKKGSQQKAWGKALEKIIGKPCDVKNEKDNPHILHITAINKEEEI